MTKAIESGMPKLRIEESAAKKQAAIDSGRDVIVGVNKYRLAKEDPIDVLDVDNAAVREAQITRLRKMRQERNEKECTKALAAISEACASGRGNLLELSINAARQRASVGEISDAMEAVFGRHRAEIKLVSGAYGSVVNDDDEFTKVKSRVDAFASREGRRPRILIAKMGQDGHDRGAKVVASAYADIGYDVDVSPLFQTPEEAAKMAVENDVHVIGVSSLAAGHKTLVPQLVAELKKLGAEDIVVVCGGVIPQQDYAYLTKAGAAKIFGPGTSVTASANETLDAIEACC